MRTIQAAISDMLRENTGINMCDSGGNNGRLWQQNQNVTDFDAQPVFDVDICASDDIAVYYDVYHYLTLFLEITEISEGLNNALAVAEPDLYGTGLMDYFINEVIIDDIDNMYDIFNTYNSDTILSTTLQYVTFELDGDDYIILQIHTGADVRGGYTEPQIFAIDDVEYFYIAMSAVYASCECSHYDSDDSGCTYRDENGTNVGDAWILETDKTISCKKCGTKVEFYGMESY